MIQDIDKYIVPMLGNNFIKDVYFGDAQVLGFRNIQDRSDHSRCISIGYNWDTDVLTSGGIEVKGICSKFDSGVYSWGTTGSGIRIFIGKYPNPSDVIYTYEIKQTGRSGTFNGNVQYTTTIKKGDILLGTYTAWTYIDSPQPFVFMEYDFENRCWRFTALQSSSVTANPNKVSITDVAEYEPCRFRLYGLTNDNISLYATKITIQD